MGNDVTNREAARLAALRKLNLVDSAAEPEFEDLVVLAAAICQTPICMLSVIDEARQLFLAMKGMDTTENARDQSFCQYTILQDNMLVVEDTKEDAFLRNHPSVVTEPAVRFYAGINILTPDNHAVGTLCVADYVPRQMSALQISTLKVLAKQANARLELRQRRIELEESIRQTNEAKAKLAASEARFKAFMDSAPFMATLKDAEGRVLFYNRAVAERAGISREAGIGKTLDVFLPKGIAEARRAYELEVLKTQQHSVVDEAYRKLDGAPAYFRTYRFPCQDGDNELIGSIAVDVTDEMQQRADLDRYREELEVANARLTKLAATDVLTGLSNRRAFDERLLAEFTQARRKKRPLAVMLIDIDDFKRLNDEFGHGEGDLCLQEMARLLESVLRKSDLIARYGGEEFALLFPDTRAEQAEHLAHRLIDAVRMHPWRLLQKTVSGGVAVMTTETVDQHELVRKADAALYRAKDSGKNQIVVSQ